MPTIFIKLPNISEKNLLHYFKEELAGKPADKEFAFSCEVFLYKSEHSAVRYIEMPGSKENNGYPVYSSPADARQDNGQGHFSRADKRVSWAILEVDETDSEKVTLQQIADPGLWQPNYSLIISLDAIRAFTVGSTYPDYFDPETRQYNQRAKIKNQVEHAGNWYRLAGSSATAGAEMEKGKANQTGAAGAPSTR